jgi:hypothetical protein
MCASACVLQVDVTEYTFKLALLQRKYEQVIAMIKSSALCGSAIIAYLQAKGYPEVRSPLSKLQPLLLLLLLLLLQSVLLSLPLLSYCQFTLQALMS